MVKLIILENYEKINNFIDQSFLHCLLCRCKIQQNSWKMLLGLSLSPDYGIHLYAEFYADSTFLYRSAGCYDIIGHWYISGDTVILSSPNFNVETRPIDLYIFAEEEITDWRFPDEYYKFTDMEGNRDAYIIKGDTLSMSIAAASILAKVTRDHLMIEYAKKYPQYGFEKHKGYGTAMHINAIKEYGPCPLHRKSFIKNFI